MEVHNGSATASGRLLSVETVHKQKNKDEFEDITAFSIITDSGEMKNFELGSGTSVRVAERELTDEVSRYLSLIGSSRARDVRRMSFTATGTGDRDVFVSYISEVPIWKSTYRIIFPENEKPLLQGWAIVDNTIGEDWKDVQLSLVAGAPQSFIQDISQPFYSRRPVVALPESIMLTPQSHEATITNGSPNLNAQFTTGSGSGVGSGSGGGMGGGVFRSANGSTGLSGLVKDPSGAGVSGAHVTVRNEETGVAQEATTDRQGRYRFSGIQPGNSALFVNAPGFQRFNLSNVYIGVGRTNQIDATLNIGVANESVDVIGATPTIETSTAVISSHCWETRFRSRGQTSWRFL